MVSGIIMVKGQSNSTRGNLLPPLHGLLFLISGKGSLYAPSHRQDSTYHGICESSCGALTGTRNSSWVHHGGSIGWGVRCSSMVDCLLMVWWVIGSIPHGGLRLSISHRFFKGTPTAQCLTDWMNGYLTTPQLKVYIGYWVSDKIYFSVWHSVWCMVGLNPCQRADKNYVLNALLNK